MTIASAAKDLCLSIELGSGIDLVLGLGVFVIPAVAIPLIARTARQYPSRFVQRDGRRSGGIQVYRWGWVLTGLCLVGLLVVALTPSAGDAVCDEPAGYGTLIGVIGILVGALMIGGGWAYAVRGTWVVLATIAVLDLLILYVNVLISIYDPAPAGGLLLLAFCIHGLCTTVAARWSFTAKDLGSVQRAKAGEAGRTLSAVWVFLAAYTVLTVGAGGGIFETAAGSAVIGALTLGALAVTMGSGYTKYAEAMNSPAAAGRQDTVVDAGVGVGSGTAVDAGVGVGSGTAVDAGTAGIGSGTAVDAGTAGVGSGTTWAGAGVASGNEIPDGTAVEAPAGRVAGDAVVIERPSARRADAEVVERPASADVDDEGGET